MISIPYNHWNRYQDGTITTSDRNTLSAVYPSIYKQMVDKVLQAAYDPRNKPLSNAQTMHLSILTGLPLNQSLKNIAAIQAAIATPAQQAPQGKQPKQRQRAPKWEHAPSLETDVQRRSSPRSK